MISVNTNFGALKAQLAAKNAVNAQELAMTRISSGLRVNSSADDAAGSAVAMKLHAKIAGQAAAIKTAGDAIALLKAQEAGLEHFQNIVFRIRDIATQMSNGSYSQIDRDIAQVEVDEMTDQFSKVALGTKFNNKDILNGTTPAYYNIQIGPDGSDNFTISVIEGATLATNLPSQSSVSSQSDAVTTMNTMPSVLADIGGKMAIVGASINRLLSSISNLSQASVNSKRALGRIVDADYSKETSKMSKNMILSQLANQMISTANDFKRHLVQLIQ